MLIKEKINLDIKGLIENGPITIVYVGQKEDGFVVYKKRPCKVNNSFGY